VKKKATATIERKFCCATRTCEMLGSGRKREGIRTEKKDLVSAKSPAVRASGPGAAVLRARSKKRSLLRGRTRAR